MDARTKICCRVIIIAEEHLLKIVVAGDGGVGKTTLLHKYVTGVFLANTTMTIGVQFHVKRLRVGDATCTLQLWDLGGQEQFRFILPEYVRGAKGAMLMFDTTRITSIENLEEWVALCRTHNHTLPILLCGTKIDCVEERAVPAVLARRYLEPLSLFDYLELSAKTGQNVEKAFELLVKKLI